MLFHILTNYTFPFIPLFIKRGEYIVFSLFVSDFEHSLLRPYKQQTNKLTYSAQTLLNDYRSTMMQELQSDVTAFCPTNRWYWALAIHRDKQLSHSYKAFYYWSVLQELPIFGWYCFQMDFFPVYHIFHICADYHAPLCSFILSLISRTLATQISKW